MARLRRIALIAAVIALIPVAKSFIAMATEPTNTAFNVRAVEWLRDNGAAGIVAKVESVYYCSRRRQGRRHPACASKGRRRRRRFGDAELRISPTARTAAPPPRARGRGGLARNPAGIRNESAGAAHDHPRPARIPACRGGTGLDQHKATEARAEPRPPGAIGELPRGEMEVPSWARHSPCDLQQRLQARGLQRRVRSERPHLRADARRAGNDRRLHRRPR